MPVAKIYLIFQLSGVGESMTFSFEIVMIVHVEQLTFKALGGSFKREILTVHNKAMSVNPNHKRGTKRT